MATLSNIGDTCLLVEFSKPGYAKRFVYVEHEDTAGREAMVEIAQSVGAALRFIVVDGPLFGTDDASSTCFKLPRDSAAAVIGITTYFTTPTWAMSRTQHTHLSGESP